MITALAAFLLGYAAGYGWQRLHRYRRRYGAPLTYVTPPRKARE